MHIINILSSVKTKKRNVEGNILHLLSMLQSFMLQHLINVPSIRYGTHTNITLTHLKHDLSNLLCMSLISFNFVFFFLSFCILPNLFSTIGCVEQFIRHTALPIRGGLLNASPFDFEEEYRICQGRRGRCFIAPNFITIKAYREGGIIVAL